MHNEVKRQTKDLLSYYPGRGKVALLWLIALPILSFLVFVIWFGGPARVTSDGVPTYMFYMFGRSFYWIYNLSLVIMLLRICHSSRKLWRDTVIIMASSLSYALIVGLPIVFFAFVWILCHAGTSAMALFQVLTGLTCTIGALLLLLICLAALAHRFGIIVPFLLFLTRVYIYALPTYYSVDYIPSQWLFLQTFALPLAPSIILLRDGMLNQGLASASFWLGALFHAVLGYGLAFWIWKRSSEPATAPSDMKADTGWLGKLFNATPKEKLNGIRLDTSRPYWEVKGKTTFASLLRALGDFLPEGCILYFEGGSRDRKLLEFFNAHATSEQTHVAIGILWPSPVYYHVPATPQNLAELARLAESHAEPELAVNFHVYRDGKVLLQWHDAFSGPMLLDGEIPESKVQALASALGMKHTLNSTVN